MPHSYPSISPENSGEIEGLKWAIGNKINLINMSMAGIAPVPLVKAETEAYNKGIFLVCSSGNEGENRLTDSAKQEQWFSVGACHLINGLPVRQSYSSTGKELDVMGFSNLYVRSSTNLSYTYQVQGTSFSSPFITGMLALFYQWFNQKYKRLPTCAETKTFIYANCKDLEKIGLDSETGHGLLVLPSEIDMEVEIVEIKMKIDSTDIYIDGVKETTTTPAKLINGSTYLPLRFITEKLKGKSISDLKWNNINKEVTIITS